MKTRVVAWWSGGIASAYACYWAVKAFRNVAIVFIDTRNEHPDTYRFKNDCERKYGKQIEVITNELYPNIEAVWTKFLSLNTAHGAICSTELKRQMREMYQDLENDYAQIFGFDVTERNRHNNMRKNYPEINVISPLADLNMTKSQVVNAFKDLEIEIPVPYKLGYRNNNCFQTGCVQGGIGYWQKIQKNEPDKFKAMADREHRLTNIKGSPVTICKDQSKNGGLVFLLPHPNYPGMKDLSMMKGIEPEPLIECNGFCSTKD